MKNFVVFITVIIMFTILSCNPPSERVPPPEKPKKSLAGKKGVIKNITIWVSVPDGVTKDSILSIKPLQFDNMSKSEIVHSLKKLNKTSEDILMVTGYMSVDTGKVIEVGLQQYMGQKPGDTVYLENGNLIHPPKDSFSEQPKKQVEFKSI